jgi:hypothetical protein
LLGRLTRIAVETVLTFYAARAGVEGDLGAKSGAIIAVQGTSADLRLNPHFPVHIAKMLSLIPARSGPPA